MSSRYTANGKRKSSMVHANRSWTCPCGRTVWGNGGKAAHQRSCVPAIREQMEIHRSMSDPNGAGSLLGWERRGYHQAEAERWGELLQKKEVS